MTQGGNTIGGGAVTGPVVQAGQLHGGIHIHDAPPLTQHTPPSPRQLPPVPGGWIDREAALATVRDLVTDHCPLAVGIVAIHGPGGIGKTALATVAVHQLAEQVPDGHFYTDLRACPQPAGILRRWLRALGLGPHLPADPAELAATWRTLTATRRIAILLDNADHADQLHPLLPGGTGSLVLATSRRPLYPLITHGALLYELGALPRPAARRLLERYTRHLPRQPDLTDLAAVCAGSPLALSLHGALLATHPTPTPAPGPAPHLPCPTAHTPQETAVAHALHHAYTRLSDEARSLYHTLGLLPTPETTAPLAAAAGAIKETTAATLLQTLADAHLLEQAAAPGRYRLHDLARQHAHHTAHDHLTPEEKGRALRRLVDWCLHRASAAEALLTPSHVGLARTYAHEPATAPPFADDAGALAWLEAHHQILMAAVRAAAEVRWHTVCGQLVDAMWPLFLRLRPYESWIEAHQIGLASARAARDQAAEARMLTSGGVGLYSTGRHQDALAWYTRALTLAQETGNRRDQAQALNGLGSCCFGLGRLAEAENYHQRARTAREAIGYRRGAALSTIRLGEIALAQEHYQQAAALLATARDQLLAENDHYDAARARALHGYALAADGQHEHGTAELRAALREFERRGSRFWQARTLEMLGQTATGADTAHQYYQRAYALLAPLSPADAERVARRLHTSTSGGDAA